MGAQDRPQWLLGPRWAFLRDEFRLMGENASRPLWERVRT